MPATVGEAGWSDRERLWARPTLEFNGIWGGYSGPGQKTIIPASAGAKITCRLVPNQDPARIAEQVRDAVLAAAPVGVTVTAEAKEGGRPVVTSIDHPAVLAASRAMESIFGTTPALTREGGSIPPVESFARVMGLAGGARRPRAAGRSDPCTQREVHPRHVLQGHSRSRPSLG